MGRWLLGLVIMSISWALPAYAQKIVQRDFDPPQRNLKGVGRVSKVEYTNHKMIVHFVADDRGEPVQSASLYGPGHQNSWRLYDTRNNLEYALLYIRNIRVESLEGEKTVDILDEPRGVRFRWVYRLTCEAHFERPGKGVQSVDLIEEDVEYYINRRDPYNPLGGSRSQWPYNVYELRVLPFTDDLRNSKPPVTASRPSAPAKTPPKTTAPPPVAKATPKPAPKDTVVAKAPPVEPPAPAPKVENFGSKVEAGRTYRLNNLLFRQSDYHIQPSSYPQLDTLASLMKDNPTMEIELAGHTDNVGDPKLNVALSRQRVDAVKSYLTNKGIQAARIKTQANGGSKPIADNTREETRRLNRRVEVTILRE
ncbi:OmpA family protein [Larkinella soli]|uniref:OmpA family protein n=1 Tax=Larkinella soli TaxID=1770527 RepID=UPI000FFBCD43|nr:OmpA family protein [Larkinella soli]